MTIRTHVGDLSDAALALYTESAAIDTETMGLMPHRDRLCVVQLSPGDGSADVAGGAGHCDQGRVSHGVHYPPTPTGDGCGSGARMGP